MLNPLVRQSLMIANRCEAQGAMCAELRERPMVLDRYTLSGLIFGEAEGLDPQLIRRMTKPLLTPQLTVILDIPVQMVAQRRPQARDANERNLDLLRHTRAAYRAVAGLHSDDEQAPCLSDRWSVQHVRHEPGFGYITAVDATQPLADVQEQCLRVFRHYLLSAPAHVVEHAPHLSL